MDKLSACFYALYSMFYISSFVSARNASRGSSVTLSPEEEEELNQNTVGILGQLLSPDMVDSLTNGTDTSVSFSL